MLLSFKSIRYITINRLAVNFASGQFQGSLVTLNSYHSCYCHAIRTLSVCPSVFIALRFFGGGGGGGRGVNKVHYGQCEHSEQGQIRSTFIKVARLDFLGLIPPRFEH